jgi:GDPmannose 4,6-dehydratase
LVTKSVLITGISGFVGPFLARRLLDSGNEITGLINKRADSSTPTRLRGMGTISNMHLISGDITDLTSLLSAIDDCQPDWIFHLAAQSYVPESFKQPLHTFKVNCLGTHNILEAVRLKGIKSRIIFAGSSEEYGMQFKDINHFNAIKKKYGVVEPPPKTMPELPVDEDSYLRPMSPYATSKVYGDYAFRNYHNTYGLNTVVSRAFNHEGPGRGHNFVTSTIVRQVVSVHLDIQNVIIIGDIQSFRDWSHVEDIVDGYVLLAERADAGSVFVQGSMRTNSVLSYILYAISALRYRIEEVYSLNGEKRVKDPLSKASVKFRDTTLSSNIVDQMLLSGSLDFSVDDLGIIIQTDKRKFKVQFDPSRFRPSDVPILLSNTEKIKQIGFSSKKSLQDIITDQINYYLDPDHREHLIDC